MDWILIMTMLITQPDGRIMSMTLRTPDLPHEGCRALLDQARAPRTDGVRVLVAECVRA